MTRFLPPILLALLLIVTTIAGWGGSSQGDPDVIKVVSSLPRTGSAKAQTDTIVGGIKMALAEAGNRAGRFEIEYGDRDDATAGAGQWTAEAETANANRAVRDP
ncbi:MAG: branched-chain amino acid ABC transporter substrate-binding protein, partial [Pirellulales bacterium]